MMRRIIVAALLASLCAHTCALAQSGRVPRPPLEKGSGAEKEVPPEADDDEEPVRVETTLVTVPVIVSDRGGRYVPDLKAEELSISEDGAEQRVAFFAAVNAPFHVVLMLDTSASATVEKLAQVQSAAAAFVEQLQDADRVKVISFDDQVRELSDFTGDRAVLAAAIRATRPGQGTRLYDAFDRALRALGRVRGRKAVVLFTDGVDFHSERRTFDDNRRAVEEGTSWSTPSASTRARRPSGWHARRRVAPRP